MEREEFLRGVAALKKQIKLEEGVQRRDKRIIRMPRKTKEDFTRLGAAIREREKDKKYPHNDVSRVQSDAASRKCWLTALYVAYNLVRGKMVAQRSDRLSQDVDWGYPRKLQRAREIFDDAVAAQPAESHSRQVI